ncbi:tetratricopeptide repeat protein [Myxococcota bacterium]|nr:tetratricopeptide repeat protein [Myxococcota bacterium]
MRTNWRPAEIADAALWLAIIFAPLAGGSSSTDALPVLAALASIALVASIFEHRREGHRLYFFALPLGLFVLSLFTLLQVVPLPGAVLGLVSPRAHELRTFVGLTGWGTLSYEPAATSREVAKLAIYAMIALAAADRARLRKSFELVAAPVVIAGVASILVARIHGLLDADRMLGLFSASKSPASLLTTFVNPNHASAFLLLVSLVAVGQSLVDAQRPGRRYLYASAGGIAAIGSALCFSRGGLGALVGSYALAMVLLLWRQRKSDSEQLARAGLAVSITILLAAIGVSTQYQELLRAFSATEADPLGVATKLAAIQDAYPLVLDHAWLGSGRGAYVSAYPAYKATSYQLTFTHPENLVVGLVADWGVVVGGAALIGLVWAIVRRIQQSTSPAVLMVTAGILVITAQNLVDFNLELPGMAVPVVALLGAATTRELSLDRIWPKKKRLLRAIMLAPIVVSVVGIWGAYAFGDLERDLATLRAAVEARKLDRTTKPRDPDLGAPAPDDEPTFEALVDLARRHPANPVIAAQLSYLAETARPPDYPAAMRWANRALYLAPTYADGHIAVGRMLVRAGHREQGFEQLRRGWALTSDERRSGMIRHVVSLAKTLPELKNAIPRKDEALDLVDEGQIATAIVELHALGRIDWAKELLASIDLATVDADDTLRVGRAAMLVGDLDQAYRLVEARLDKVPTDAVAGRVLVEVLSKQGDPEKIYAVADRITARTDGVDPAPFLRLRFHTAVKQRDLDDAQKTLDQLARRLSPTVEHQLELARLEATLAEKGGSLDRALRALDKANQLSRGNTGLKYLRAELLTKMGRVTEARAEAESILRLDPDHKQARSLLGKLRASKPLSPPGREEEP